MTVLSSADGRVLADRRFTFPPPGAEERVGRAIDGPHLFEVVEFADLGAEDVDDHVARVDHLADVLGVDQVLLEIKRLRYEERQTIADTKERIRERRGGWGSRFLEEVRAGGSDHPVSRAVVDTFFASDEAMSGSVIE